MKTKTKIGLSILVALIIIVGGMYVLDELFFRPNSFIQNMTEKPPEDPALRKDWVAEKVLTSIYDHDNFNMGYKIPSQRELNKLKKQISLERVYPKFMNSIMEYGTDTYTANLLYFEDELKDLGINTFVVLPLYHVENGRLEFFFPNPSGGPMLLSDDKAKRSIAHSILMAKQQGYTVILMPDYPDFENGGFADLTNPDDFEAEIERITLELAPIAEEYGAEYLAASNAIEMLMVGNGYELDEVYDRTNAYNKSIVPKIKELYSGKIMYKMGGIGNWQSYKNISVKGADLFGFTGCFESGINLIKSDIRQAAQVADIMSKRDGVPWMNIEFFVRTEKDHLRDFGKLKEVLPMKEAYDVGLAAFKTYSSKAIGFTITGWLGAGKIRGTEAVPLVKEFFESKLK